MAHNFTKLFGSITASTIWCESSNIRIVWVTMLAMCDRHGRVHASVPGLARIANVEIDECRIAIRKFLAPDEDSRTPDNEGRRIAEIEGGWKLLNHSKYRDLEDNEAVLESKRKYAARKRAEEKAKRLAEKSANEANRPVILNNANVTINNFQDEEKF